MPNTLSPASITSCDARGHQLRFRQSRNSPSLCAAHSHFFPEAISPRFMMSRTISAKSRTTASMARHTNFSFIAKARRGRSARDTRAFRSRFAPSGSRCSLVAAWAAGSYVLAGLLTSETKAFSSACHGAGRALSRHAALQLWSGRKIVDDLAAEGIFIRSPSSRGVAEEAPGAYKDVDAVVRASEQAGLAKRVARLRPLICIKG